MRRSILVLVVVLVASLTIGQSAYAGLSDEPVPDHWAYDAYMTVYSAGLIEGYPDGTFQGERQATRYEVVQFLARLMHYFQEELAAVSETLLSEEDVKALIAESLAEQNSLPPEAIEGWTEEIYAALQELEDEFRADLDALDVRVTLLETAVGKLQAETAALSASIVELQDRLDGVEYDTGASIEELREEQAALALSVADLQNRLDGLDCADTASIEQLRADNAALTEKVAGLEQQLDKVAKDSNCAKTLGIFGVILGLLGLFM